MITRNSRRQSGSVIALSTVLALALVLLGVGFVFMLLYMGGQHETKNAVDSGALNVGKQALDNVTIKLDGSPQQNIFYGVTNDADDGSMTNDGNVSLRRINRVWAEALLIAINADAAQHDGLSIDGENNASQALAGAKSISDSLSQKLSTPSNLYGFFTDFSKANSVRMIGGSVSTDVLAGNNWQTSLMDRTPVTPSPRESNITVNSTLPPNCQLSASSVISSTRSSVPSSAGLKFLTGYTPISAGGSTFWQVPFQFDEKPRLVSGTTFDKSTNATAPLSWSQAVPNAFSVAGQTTKSGGANEKAVSWVLTNPRQSFQMAIPRSFLKIHLDQNTSQWNYFLSGVVPTHVDFLDQNYDYTITEQDSTMPAGGVACTTVSATGVTIGADVAGRPLWEVMFSPLDTNVSGDSAVQQQMLGRINEMLTKVNTSYDLGKLTLLCSQPWTIADLAAGSGPRDFYIYSPDGVNVSLVSDKTKFTAPLWLQQAIAQTPDDKETKVVSDDSIPTPDFLFPDVVPDPTCTTIIDVGWTTWDKDINWQPGTGYNGCLGQVRVTHWTTVYVWGAAAETVI